MRLPGFATRNARLKALAVALATVLWAGVAYASNPPDTRAVTVKVPQDPGAVAPFTLVHPIPPLVVRVSGTRQHLDAFDPADLVVTANYRGITQPGIQQVPVGIVNNDRDVVLDNPQPAVTAEIDRLDSRTVPVTISITHPPPQGYVVGTELATPSTVTVIGPQHQLPSLEARVTLDLSNQKTNFEADEAVAIYDRTGQRTGNLGVTAAGRAEGTVLVAIQVNASITSRASAVLPRVSGSPPPGHYLSEERVSPASVVLNGPQDLLNTLDSVPTEAISLNGVTGTVTFTVHVLPPAGVAVTPRTVTVTISVSALPQPTLSPSPSPSPSGTPSPIPTG